MGLNRGTMEDTKVGIRKRKPARGTSEMGPVREDQASGGGSENVSQTSCHGYGKTRKRGGATVRRTWRRNQ